MAQICSNCGHSASDDERYCPNCFFELDKLKEERAEKEKKALNLMAKKTLAFSVLSAVCGLALSLYQIFLVEEPDIFSYIMPLIIWLGFAGIAISYLYQCRKASAKGFNIASLIIIIAQFTAIPLMNILL